MQKLFSILLIIFYSTNIILAGDIYWYNYRVKKYYHNDNNILFISTYAYDNTGIFGSNDVKKSRITNYLIYDVNKNTKKYLFDKERSEDIVLLLFENKFNDKYGNIIFNIDYTEEAYTYGYDKFQSIFNDEKKCISEPYIFNNCSLNKRPLNDKILILLFDDDSDLYTIYTSKLDGTDLKLIIQFSEDDDWHLDLKNNKIRVFIQKGIKSNLAEFEW